MKGALCALFSVAPAREEAVVQRAAAFLEWTKKRTLVNAASTNA
ncbi:hypothetical protein X759_27135 [Mesorhizobium sp. LSHC420B00]|nr:hypothetical protein X759_27135 [Mesorhizobium sp. LSHC420B00]